jgi:hypothetical protein
VPIIKSAGVLHFVSELKDWLSRLIEAHKVYCGADYETFQRTYNEIPLFFTGYDKRGKRLPYTKRLKVSFGWGLARPYERLWSFFISYIIVQSGSSQLTLMVDQYSLWRTARAIATALSICLIEFFGLSQWILFSSLETSPSPSGFPIGLIVNPIGLFVLVIGSNLIITSVSYYIALGTYSRLCFTLFSLVYVTHDRQSAVLKDAAGVLEVRE